MADYLFVFVLMTLMSLLRLLHQNVDLLQHHCDQRSQMAMQTCFSVWCLCHCRLVCCTGLHLCSSVLLWCVITPPITSLACTLQRSQLFV